MYDVASFVESNKMDWVFKETEGNRQLIGHIANQVFTDRDPTGQLRQAEHSLDKTRNVNLYLHGAICLV